MRPFRVSVLGHIDLESADKGPEAVEHVRQVLEQVFETYGLQPGVAGVEVLSGLD
jgi:hypothetical protein